MGQMNQERKYSKRKVLPIWDAVGWTNKRGTAKGPLGFST